MDFHVKDIMTDYVGENGRIGLLFEAIPSM
jgi:hypothetical protein